MNMSKLFPLIDIISFAILLTKVTSYYGLLSTKEIKTPVLSGGTISLPFYPGFRYAAYPASKKEEVKH